MVLPHPSPRTRRRCRGAAPRIAAAGGLALALATMIRLSPLTAVTLFAKDAGNDDRTRRPKLVLTANPLVGQSPSRVVLTAQLVGGDDDYPDFYCPTVQWEWGDGTSSESTLDCAPYEAGKSKITRIYSKAHVFDEGQYRVRVRLKHRETQVASADTNVMAS
jgi:hypothetical protein